MIEFCQSKVEHQFFVSDSFFEIHVFSCLLFLISSGLILFFVVHRRVFFLLLFGLIFLLPTLIVPLNVLVNEHRLYMSLVAVSFLIAQLYTKTLKYRHLYVFCGLIFCSMIFQRNNVWATEETLWNDSRIKSPAMARPWAFWGIALGKTGNAVLAENAYKGALKIDPYHRASLVRGQRILYRILNRLNCLRRHFLILGLCLEEEGYPEYILGYRPLHLRRVAVRFRG